MSLARSASPRSTRARRSLGSAAPLLREVASRPAGLFGLSIVLLILGCVLFAPLVAPHDPAAQDVANRLSGPSATHPLGTDQLGRDLLSRIIFGARIAFQVALPTVIIALAIGLVLGLVAGYLGGWVDNAMIVIMDTLQAFPGVILALALIALLGPSTTNLIAVLVVAFIPGYARVSRALVLAAKQNQYVEAERALGASNIRIAFSHIVPNIVAPLFILMAMDLPVAITAEAGLSFLGLGVQPPGVSWGTILSDGFGRVRDAPWGVVSAGLALMLTTLGFTFLGETLRDIVDPKLVGVRRWRRV